MPAPRSTTKSTAETRLSTALRELGLPVWSQYQFHPERGWRLDLAFPDVKLGVEVDGSWHNDHQGQRRDKQKRNAAVEMGWRILAYPAREVCTNKRLERIVEQIHRVLSGVTCVDSCSIVLEGD